MRIGGGTEKNTLGQVAIYISKKDERGDSANDWYDYFEEYE